MHWRSEWRASRSGSSTKRRRHGCEFERPGATYAEFISRSGSDVPGFTTTTRVNEPGRTLWAKLDFR